MKLSLMRLDRNERLVFWFLTRKQSGKPGSADIRHSFCRWRDAGKPARGASPPRAGAAAASAGILCGSCVSMN
jgi:hypothetical protein